MSTTTGTTSSPGTVVIADDDATTRLLIRTALEQDGWAVEDAPDGARACDAVERLLPDIVLLDVSMPELDGFGACARLRRTPRCQHIPIMMVTGQDDETSIGRAYEVGATDFLSKPISFMVLRQRLQYMRRALRDSRELRNERDFVSAVVNHSAALVLILDPSGRVIRFNESCERSSGLSLSEVKDKRLWDILSSPQERDQERATFERLISSLGTNHYEGSWIAKDGSRREISWSNSVLLDSEGDVEHVVCTGLDITERTQAEERARFLTSYDPLTGLPNRQRVTQRLDQSIDGTVDDTQIAVLVLDLDRFKDVNTTWGRAAGDMLLTDVADRLAKSLRLSDVLARPDQGFRAELGRLGGDEFTVMVTGVDDVNDVATLIERLQHALGRPFIFEDQEFTVTTSVGIALSPGDGENADTLLTNAESALHVARERMRGSYHFFSEKINTTVTERFSLEHDLRRAIDHNELVLHYQQKTFVHSGLISGAEALVRWQHPTRGLLAPGAFIEVAEESGLIVQVGEWVLREACNQVMRWLASGLAVVPVAVNLSSAQFDVADLLGRIASILNQTNIDPRHLEVEITESMIMRDGPAAHEILRRLDAIGVQVAIDDFGTRYSTLSSLKNLPVQHLKIDQSFVKDLAVSSKDVAITRAIISMAHGLGLNVIAEGVETEEQLAILREEGCDEVQGFLIGKPMPSDELAARLGQQAESRGDDPAADPSIRTRCPDAHMIGETTP